MRHFEQLEAMDGSGTECGRRGVEAPRPFPCFSSLAAWGKSMPSHEQNERWSGVPPADACWGIMVRAGGLVNSLYTWAALA